MDILPVATNPWSAAEEEVLLSFLKERKGDELAIIGLRDDVWLELEKTWQALGNVKGFSTSRTVIAMWKKYCKLRKNRAKQPFTTPKPSTTSTKVPTPSVRSSSRKRTFVVPSLSMPPSSASAKKAKASPSLQSTVAVKIEAPDYDVKDAVSALCFLRSR